MSNRDRAALFSAIMLATQLFACAKQNQGSPPSSAENRGSFNAPCSSNGDCQGSMCRSGRCH